MYDYIPLHKWSDLCHLYFSPASERPVEPQAESGGTGAHLLTWTAMKRDRSYVI